VSVGGIVKGDGFEGLKGLGGGGGRKWVKDGGRVQQEVSVLGYATLGYATLWEGCEGSKRKCGPGCDGHRRGLRGLWWTSQLAVGWRHLQQCRGESSGS